MLLKELLLTEIIEVSENELEYKIMDLNSYETFSIVDYVGNTNNYQFILDIFADNVITPFEHNIKTFQRLMRKRKLYFNAVYLKKNEIGKIQIPKSVDDIAIIPIVNARGFAKRNYIEMMK